MTKHQCTLGNKFTPTFISVSLHISPKASSMQHCDCCLYYSFWSWALQVLTLITAKFHFFFFFKLSSVLLWNFLKKTQSIESHYISNWKQRRNNTIVLNVYTCSFILKLIHISYVLYIVVYVFLFLILQCVFNWILIF